MSSSSISGPPAIGVGDELLNALIEQLLAKVTARSFLNLPKWITSTATVWASSSKA
jgi:hypothetical protein